MVSKIDLSGSWELFLDEETVLKQGEINYSDDISLPNSTSNACKGKPNSKKETAFLTDAYKFEGNAWFMKKLQLEPFENKRVFLFLERTRITTAFVNGIKAGGCESLVSPHIFDVTQLLKDGENVIEICVSNKGYKTGGGHMTSPDTQSNWNGITGEISLRVFNETFVSELFVESDIKNCCMNICAKIEGRKSGTAKIQAKEAFSDGRKFEPATFRFENGILKAVYEMKSPKLWSEFEPNVYTLSVEINGDITETVVGFREFKTCGDKFTINGVKTFLRGKHDGLIFPKTGFAPTTVKEWLDVLSISKSYGINHYRFHTCCPPEAAFCAADLLGIYMEPELPFWGTVTAPDEENHNAAEQEFLISEGFNMLRAFGNHPSFCMMSMGNELWGSKERINEIIALFKKADSRHLYTQGSNNFQWFPCTLENDDFFVGVRLSKDRLIRGSYAMCDAPLGHIQTDKPSTTHDYDKMITPEKSGLNADNAAEQTIQIQYKTTARTVRASSSDEDFSPNMPIITHEIGQYETFPDFSEISKYTGPLKARNLEVFRSRLEEKGMLHLADSFFKASGRLAADCYKEELEAALRSKKLAGFQLLDLQDFTGQGTALVGILNAFMENKGSISRKEWKSFCGETVVLGKFSSYTYQAGDTVDAEILIVDFSPDDLNGKAVTAAISGKELGCASATSIISTKGENYIDAGKISVTLPLISEPTRAVLDISIEGTDVKNSYTLWVYPRDDSTGFESGVHIFESLTEQADALLERGKTVLITPGLTKLENSIEGFYATDFWCYPMFRSISAGMNRPEPVGTMGLLIDSSHPALAAFPCESYTTPQWWEIVSSSRSEILDGNFSDKTVIVQTIDNFERNHVLGLLYEYRRKNGRVVVLNADVKKLSLSPEGRQLLRSVANYCKS